MRAAGHRPAAQPGSPCRTNAAGPAQRGPGLQRWVLAGARREVELAPNVTKDLQAALERLALPRQRLHDLRHAYATLMIEDGEELAVVSRTPGHADLSTTADVYAHLTPAMQRRAAQRMDRILGAASG
ncbi:MAG TPA: tyrosine-type recombinase/integrase [Candidatus Limnocylindrales bacterium]